MFNVCSKCGEYRVDKRVEISEKKSFAICPECNHAHEFLRMPLFIVTGPSGAGKTTLAAKLSALTKDFVVLDLDILWDNRYNTPETNYREYRELWLRMAKNIGQSGKPVVLCGTAMPDQIEPCVERRYFSDVFYLALVCENEELTRRLQQRPAWRNSGSEAFIQAMVSYNNWLHENGEKNEPVIDLLDTTHLSQNEAARKVTAWAAKRMQL